MYTVFITHLLKIFSPRPLLTKCSVKGHINTNHWAAVPGGGGVGHLIKPVHFPIGFILSCRTFKTSKSSSQVIVHTRPIL